jgi:hypothetical protein
VSQTDSAHAWWSRLRHQGLLLSPVVMVERYADAPPSVPFYVKDRLRSAHTRLLSSAERNQKKEEFDQAAILSFVDSLLENFVGHPASQVAKQHSIPDKLTVAVRIGTRSETIKPHRIHFADESGETPALMVMADTSPHVGRGRGRTMYARFLELLRGTGHRLGLLTNGQQFRLIYAGLDFESWCEWESERWFDDGEGTEELLGLRQLLSAESLKPAKEGVSGLLDAVEESRKRQADLSSVLRENVRQAVELLLEDVSTANRVHADLFNPLVSHGDRTLTDAEAHEALMQAAVRIVMRLVVCLFAESRQLLPTNDPIYGQSYGVRTLYELLDQAARYEGGTHVLFNKQTAWPRLMALFRLIHNGSSHGAFPLRPYGGVLFRPGDDKSDDPVSRALHILEHSVSVGDATIFYVLKKLLRGPLPVIKGKSKTYVEGPVDYTDLRTEFIGLIYEGLLDYRLKRTDEQIGPQIFLNIGREPVLPLSRLTDMLQTDKKGLKDLLATLGKEKAASTAAEETEESDEDAEEQEESSDEESTTEETVEVASTDELQRGGDYLDAVEAAKAWAKEAVVLAGIVPKQKKNQNDAEYQTVIEAEANRLIKRVVSTGEFYLVRAGNTRKGTGTFYTRPQLAVPTVHRTLQPLCYDKADDGTLTPKTPEEILGLKVCDPACGSASFLVAALHYLTDALYRSLCHHKKLDDPATSKKITLPFGRPRTNTEADQLVPFPPDDPQRGDTFEDRIKALLRRHVVERCIYGVDINALAVELARVSLWVETLDPELPFSFLDHKIKVGNSLVGCWLDRVEDYPLKAWEREGGDGPKGERSQRIEEFLKGPKVGNRRTGDGRIKQEMRQVIESKFSNQAPLFPDMQVTTESVVTEARVEYEKLHDLPVGDPDERERYYRDHILSSPTLRTLKAAMDEWCAIWFWPTDEESLKHVPTPLTFHEAKPEKDAIVERLASEVKFFHWELEFPDVFTTDRSGFDGMIGNPPWDVMKPNSHEFFTEYDPLYRTLDKQAALRKQKELFGSVEQLEADWDEFNGLFKAWSNWVKCAADPFDVSLARGKEGEGLSARWSSHRNAHCSLANRSHLFHLQGGADLNSYKLFAEVFWASLRSDGRLGVILPTGIYSDLGTKDLRQELLDRGRLDFLYAFQNERRVFAAAHHAYKQLALIATKGGRTAAFDASFRMGVGNSPEAHEIPDDILRSDGSAMRFTPDDVRQNSPQSLSIVELGTKRDLALFRTIYDHSVRIGDSAPGWDMTYACEFHMTNDSKLFPPREKWEEKGYRPDVFGRWIGPDGDVALPLYQGGMIHHFDCSFRALVSGTGRSAVWQANSFDNKAIRPCFLMSADSFRQNSKYPDLPRIGYRGIAPNTNTRSMVACYLPPVPCGNSIQLLIPQSSPPLDVLLADAAALSSLAFDFVLRQRIANPNLNWFVMTECPVPALLHAGGNDEAVRQLAIRTARATLLHRRFAPEWLNLKSFIHNLSDHNWKHLWAVTEADRLRLRVEIDALVAELYGLDPDDFDWIVREDPKDPKGFYRVDRQLPFRERLTGLSAAAFRAIKEGKWSAETAADLSNDEFFDILGIPEMTNAEAAKAKGQSGPLIFKRDGCHVWKPENFAADDPRHGWTWDDCWNDAVALLGSEDAVREYIEGKRDQPEEEPEHTGPRDLFGDPIIEKPKQKKLF